MSTKEITTAAMALPLGKRVQLAQALWESIHAGLPESVEQAAVKESVERDRELGTGLVKGRTHEQVMRAARNALR